MLSSRYAFRLIESYSLFARDLAWFRMYCAGQCGKSVQDYVAAHETIRAGYEELIREIAAPASTTWDYPPAREMLRQIGVILYSSKLTEKDIGHIGKIVFDFENEEGHKFRREWFDACLLNGYGSTQQNKKLFQETGVYLKAKKFDTAVITAFKFLEEQLQSLLKVPPHDYYGEKLINHAFAPNSGKLQLGKSDSEQQGLRNFFSGAYALFRNPSAHRFVEYSEYSAEVIVHMVAMMNELAHAVRQKRSKKTKT